jgi:hypothetical protein
MKLKRNIYLCFNKAFTRTTLVQNKEVLRSYNDSEVALNWSLSKLFIHSNKYLINTIEAGKENHDSEEAPVVKTIKEVGLLKFMNYQRKMGKIITDQSEIYIQMGKLGEKNIRIISTEKDTITKYTSLLESKLNLNSQPALDIVVMTKGELKVKPFVLSNPDAKVIITNSTNVNFVKDLISKI